MAPDTTPHTLEAVSAARWRVALSLTVAMMAVYFGFILLVAFNKPLLGRAIAPGLSLGCGQAHGLHPALHRDGDGREACCRPLRALDIQA